MDRSSTEDYGTGCMSSSQTEDISAEQQCQSVDSRAEWRSSEQLENGTPSTSPPYWDTDLDDDDGGPKPSELFRKFTWKIENYSQINKRELRSNAFEVGGYKWYILIYPQGCDVCNHLSLFLCVANHDKLLPGWSHFAQFTISVINKDPKFSKFSDTLHRFWKKEHDWGWKKFMELSKVEDGFVNNETLVIKAQVQVIREKANRLFRCLDCQYRRELVQVYLSNVEQICRRFFEDRKNKLSKLIDDKVRWSSFCSFWLGVNQNSRRRIARDKLDTILRVVVKHFFVEKEVTSTLVMDSLYSGLKALQCESKNKKEGLKVEMEESAVPMVRVDEDMFTLADDVISLLERVASEPLPAVSLPIKDDRISLNRSKEGNSDEFKGSIERYERRLTELGRRTVEIFVLVHIFSNRIEVAYQEAIAYKRQEDLIREEEAAGQAEQELKARRAAAEKDKRTKKKQRKQKRNNRKKKEKDRDLKSDSAFNDQNQEEKSPAELASGESSLKDVNPMAERMGTPEDASESDVSYNGDDADEPLYPDLEDRDTDESDLRPSIEANAGEISNRRPEKANVGLDDGSSTCSTDSVPSLVPKGKSLTIGNIRTSPSRGRARGYGSKDLQKHRSVATASHHFEILDSSPSTGFQLERDDGYQRRLSIQGHETHMVEKRKPTAILLEKTSNDHQGAVQKPSNIRPLESPSILPYSGRRPQPVLQQPKQSVQNRTTASTAPPAPVREPPSAPKRSPAPSAKSPYSSTSRSEPPKRYPTPIARNITAQPATPFSRPSAAAPVPAAPKPTTAAISRPAGTTGPSAADPSLPSPTYVPQSYLNAIIGRAAASSNPVGLAHSAPIPSNQSSSSSSQSTFLSSSASLYPPPLTSRIDRPPASRTGFTFGSVEPAAVLPQSIRRASTELWNSNHPRETVSTARLDPSHRGLSEEFPHMGIINDLLNEEQSTSYPYHGPLHHRHRSFAGPYSFPDGAASADLSLLNRSSGAFHQTQLYYDDGFLGVPGDSSGRPLDGHFAPPDFPTAYANFQMGGRIQSQRPYRPANLSFTNPDGRTNRGGGAYSYNSIWDYINQGYGPGGRRFYRP